MRRVLIVSAVCLALAVGLMLWGFSGGAPAAQGTPPHALLVVEDDTGSFQMQLRKGLQEAVADRGGRLQVETLANLPAGGPDAASYTAVFLWLRQPEALIERLGGQGAPLIVLDHQLRGQYSLAFNEAEGARQLALLAQRQRRSGPAALIADPADPLQARRLEGALPVFDGAEPVMMPPDAIEPGRLRDAAFVLALSGGAVDSLAALKRAGLLPQGLPVYGVEAEEQRAQYMEAGLLQGVAAASPYAMGYAAGEALDLIARRDFTPALRLLPLQLVTPDTMYEARYVKEMFPLLQ